MEQRYLIILSGATAVGKTDAAIELAKKFDTVVLSADSRQIYKEISIGTAKPTEEELQGVPHFFINHVSIEDSYTVGDYEKEALQVLDDCFKKRPVVLLVGGTGFYIRAITEGLDELPASDPEIQKELEGLFKEQGIEALQQSLQALDPVYYEQIDIQNPHRLMRAINICRSISGPIASVQKKPKNRPFKVIHLNLVRSRENLYARINHRVDAMLMNGLEAEARRMWGFQHCNALQTMGYREWFDYFEGKADYHTTVEKIKQNSRRYAKRQLTWFRNVPDTKHFKPGELENMQAYIQFMMENNASFRWERQQKTKYADVRFTFATLSEEFSWLATFYKGKHQIPDSVAPLYDKWIDHEISLMPFWF